MLKVQRKLTLLRHAQWMQQGGLLAQTTSTLAGVACLPSALLLLRRFKQRQGSFLLLAADIRSALRLTPYVSPLLRQQLRQGWPEKTTFIVSARATLSRNLVSRGTVAVRVDGNEACCFLAKVLGGFFLSSSLNRRGQGTSFPSFQFNWRWHRFLMRHDCMPTIEHRSTQASQLLRVRTQRLQRLR